MKETNALFGCEESGGYAFRGHIPERDGILSGLMVAQMIIDYGKSVSGLVQHLQDLVGPHAYARHDIAFPREGYDQRKQDVYKSFSEHEPTEFAGVPVQRVRSDDGFKFYLADGSWVLMRMSGTEPLMRVYAEAPTDARVAELLVEMERAAGVEEPAGVAS
jgi:phosphomannomutase